MTPSLESPRDFSFKATIDLSLNIQRDIKYLGDHGEIDDFNGALYTLSLSTNTPLPKSSWEEIENVVIARIRKDESFERAVLIPSFVAALVVAYVLSVVLGLGLSMGFVGLAIGCSIGALIAGIGWLIVASSAGRATILKRICLAAQEQLNPSHKIKELK